ncbi:hypothetical protein ACFPER_08435 [Agromyces aurantiacus]|uniref:Uncharacterized protein n=1 Tax=Agromyces aurantiacus TaxID=165814 RepID=A0ABV9R5C7_9MICO|nr:hypothetical protein [Agromyces aurantiacus]MBM7503495.1 hypothetical protein [Agromyces aurantiacus]
MCSILAPGVPPGAVKENSRDAPAPLGARRGGLKEIPRDTPVPLGASRATSDDSPWIRARMVRIPDRN